MGLLAWYFTILDKIKPLEISVYIAQCCGLPPPPHNPEKKKKTEMQLTLKGDCAMI